MADEKLSFLVQVNSQTGELKTVEKGLQDTAAAAEKTEKSFLGLSGQAADFVKNLLKIEAGRRVIGFLNDSINAAEGYNESLRKVRFGLESSGVSWEKNGEQIQAWAQKLQETTRFGDNEALDVLGKFVRVTNNLTEAQKATTIAMGISSATGKDLSSTQALLTDLINGNNRAVIQAQREFGGLIGNVKDTQQILDILSSTYDGAAQKEDTLTKTKAQLSNAYGDLQKTIGQDLIPVWDQFLKLLTRGITATQEAWTGIQKVTTGMAAVAAEAWIKITMKGQEQTDALKALWEDVGSKWEELEQKKTATTEAHENNRLQISKKAIAQKAEDEKKDEEERQKNLEAVHVAQQDAHVKAFEEEKKVREKKAKQEVEEAKKKSEIEKKQRESTLSDTISNLKELSKHSGEAFEAYKALATAETIISTYEGAQNAFTSLAKIPLVGPALGGAAAAVALAAGFARVAAIQSQTRPTFHTGGTIPGAGDVPITAQGGEFVVNRRAATENRPLLEAINRGGGGGSAGGINVNVTVNFSADRFSIDSGPTLISALAAEVARETSEAVKLAVKMNDVAGRNSNMAV